MSSSTSVSWTAPNMNMLAKIRRNKSLTGSSVRTKSQKHCWPNPEASIGRFISKIGSQSCWEAIGPARKAFVAVAKQIKDYLDDYSEPIPTWITWSIYMIGVTSDCAIPTIIFCCEQEVHRKTVRNTIRESKILQNYPGIALKHLPRAPDYNQLVQLASKGKGIQSESQGTNESQIFRPLVFSLAHRISSGYPLFIHINEKDAFARKATAGGAIHIKGKQYLMTAAHAFTNELNDSSPKTQQDADMYFSESDDDDMMTEGSHISQDSDIGSIETPPSRDSSGTSSMSYALRQNHTNEPPPYTSEDVLERLNLSDATSPHEELQTLPEYSALIGTLVFSSCDSSNPALDYALVQLNEDSTFVEDFHSPHKPKELHLPAYASVTEFQNLVEATYVNSATASTGLNSGFIYSTPTFLRQPNSSVYQEVYTVKFRKPLSIGDCGSWVLSKGKLQGHIIAGSPSTGMAYIVPAYQVFADIQENLEQIQLASIDAVKEDFLNLDTYKPDYKGKEKELSGQEYGYSDLLPLYGEESLEMTAIGSSSTTRGYRSPSPPEKQDPTPEIQAEELTRKFRQALSARRIQSLSQARSHEAELRQDIHSTAQHSTTEHDKPPSYTSICNVPLEAVSPVSRHAIQFKNRLLLLSLTPMKWENAGLLDEALQVIPLEKIYNEAEEESQILQAEALSLGEGKRAWWSYEDCVARALLRWFKRSFFQWVNNPTCSICMGPTRALGLTAPTQDETAGSASHVELYQCTGDCEWYERFPRYKDPFVLLRTRRGRVGEWTNCFGMLCRAMGCRVRWIHTPEDQDLLEVYSAHRKRWVHVDPCEEAWDKPLLYTEGLGMKFSYCIAFSVDGAFDVTCRYVRRAKFSLPRTRSSEAELLGILDEITALRREKLSKQERMSIEKERMQEKRELRGFIISALVSDLCRLRFEELEDGTIRITGIPENVGIESSKARSERRRATEESSFHSITQ